MRIPFHRSTLGEREAAAAARAVAGAAAAGDARFLARVERRLRRALGESGILAVSSGTHALELCAQVLGLGPGDDVVVPAFTFPATANAFARAGARVRFADCSRDDPLVDPDDVKRRMGPSTRAVVAVHYGGLPAAVPALWKLCRDSGAALVEDAAHAFGGRAGRRPLGTLCDLGCFSFHRTKDIACGEGGALFARGPTLLRRAERLREFGTDRARFRRGEIARYTWREVGGSCLLPEAQAAILCVQLDRARGILARRRALWRRYLELLEPAARRGLCRTPAPPRDATPSGHCFWILCRSGRQRERVRTDLLSHGIDVRSHFESLDATPAGRALAEADPPCENARSVARRLLRLPLYCGLTESQQDEVVGRLIESLQR